MFDIFLALPWLKFIPAVIPTCIMLWDIRRDKRKKGWFHKRGLSVVSGISAVVACWIIAHDSRESNNWQQEAKKWQADSASQMNRIEGKLGDEAATQRYLEAVRKLTRQLTSEKTGPATDKFFESEAERSKLREEVSRANQKLLVSYQTRFEPVASFVLGKFDAWIDACRTRGIEVSVETLEMPTTTTRSGDVMKALRKVTFSKGEWVVLQLYPAVVEDGRLVQGIHFQMPFHSRNGNTAEIWGFDVNDKEYTVNNPRRTRFVFKTFTGNESNPIEDQKLMDSLNVSLDEVMAFVIEEATLEVAQ